MAESKFILYVRKFLKNPLLARKQVSIEIINPDLTALTKAQIREKLAKVMKVKEECVTIYGMKNKFGGGRASAFGLIYDSLDAKKKYDAKRNLLRDKILVKSKITRKQKKEIKTRKSKVKGTKKAKVDLGKKKK